jgi:hypothetical protein
VHGAAAADAHRVGRPVTALKDRTITPLLRGSERNSRPRPDWTSSVCSATSDRQRIIAIPGADR